MKNEIKIFKDEEIVFKDKTSLQKIQNMLDEQVESTKNISISDSFDKKYLDFVKKIKSGYVKNRNTIARVFKYDRDSHTKYNQENRRVELAILARMEGEKNRLSAEIDRAEFEIVKEERKKLIPFRKLELEKYQATATDDDLLALSDSDFEKFLTLKREEWTKKEEARIERERMLEEARKQAEKEKEEAIRKEREEAERKAREEKIKADTEAEKKEREARAREEKIKADAEAEKQRFIADQKAKEQARLDAIEAERKAREKAEKQKAEAEQKEREKAEKNAKFTKWLSDNDFDPSIMEWKQNGNHFEIWTLPKKVAEITI